MIRSNLLLIYVNKTLNKCLKNQCNLFCLSNKQALLVDIQKGRILISGTVTSFCLKNEGSHVARVGCEVWHISLLCKLMVHVWIEIATVSGLEKAERNIMGYLLIEMAT